MNVGLRCLAIFSLLLTITSCATTPKTRDQELVERGNEYATDGLLKEAADSYEKALKINSRSVSAKRNLGFVQVRMALFKPAVENLEQVIGSLENDFDTNFYLAEGYRALDKHAEAIYRYKKALTLNKNHGRTMKALAWSYFKIHYYKEALGIVKKLQEQNPDDGQAALIAARTLVKLKKNKAALATLQRAKAKSPTEALPYFESVEGDILQEMGRCGQAVGVYRSALKIQPLLAGALFGLGRCQLELKNDDDAITYIERAVRIKPKMPEAYFFLGKAYETKDKKKSLAYYRRFYKLASDDPELLAKVDEVKQKFVALNRVAPKTKTTQDPSHSNSKSLPPTPKK